MAYCTFLRVLPQSNPDVSLLAGNRQLNLHVPLKTELELNLVKQGLIEVGLADEVTEILRRSRDVGVQVDEQVIFLYVCHPRDTAVFTRYALGLVDSSSL